MQRTDKGSWSARHLDPGSHMGEILFGLIMTLTFTLGAGMVIQQDRSAPAVPNRMQRENLLGGLAACWLVFACGFPAVLHARR
jgi:hypothetical protein